MAAAAAPHEKTAMLSAAAQKPKRELVGLCLLVYLCAVEEVARHRAADIDVDGIECRNAAGKVRGLQRGV